MPVLGEEAVAFTGLAFARGCPGGPEVLGEVLGILLPRVYASGVRSLSPGAQ